MKGRPSSRLWHRSALGPRPPPCRRTRRRTTANGSWPSPRTCWARCPSKRRCRSRECHVNVFGSYGMWHWTAIARSESCAAPVNLCHTLVWPNIIGVSPKMLCYDSYRNISVSLILLFGYISRWLMRVVLLVINDFPVTDSLNVLSRQTSHDVQHVERCSTLSPAIMKIMKFCFFFRVCLTVTSDLNFHILLWFEFLFPST